LTAVRSTIQEYAEIFQSKRGPGDASFRDRLNRFEEILRDLQAFDALAKASPVVKL
jgi:hypothetical protein